MGVRVLRAALMLSLAGCCGGADPPCASWARKNHTYALELVGEPFADPYRELASCGGFIPPPASGHVTLTAGALTRGSGGDEACKCITRYAEFDYPGFEQIAPGQVESDALNGVRFPEVGYAAEVELDGGCRGNLTLGIDGWPFGRDAGPDAPGMVFRRAFGLNGKTREQCEQAGFPAGETRCADSWGARVEPTSGPRGHGG